MSPAELIAEMFLKLNKPAQIQMALKAMELLQEQETVAVICTWCDDHPIAAEAMMREIADQYVWDITNEPPTEMLDSTD